MSGPRLEAYGRWVEQSPADCIGTALTLLALWGIVPRVQSGTVVDFTPRPCSWAKAVSGSDCRREAEFGADDNTVVLLEGDISAPEVLNGCVICTKVDSAPAWSSFAR